MMFIIQVQASAGALKLLQGQVLDQKRATEVAATGMDMHRTDHRQQFDNCEPQMLSMPTSHTVLALTNILRYVILRGLSITPV